MIIYSGPHLQVAFEEENDRFINSWKKSPEHTSELKSELLEYLNALEKVNPTQIIWLQEGFKFQIDDPTKLWVEENILKPRFEAGYVIADKEGFHPIAFVVGQDVLTHMEVMGVFDKPSPSVFNPKHFATEREAREWLDDGFSLFTMDEIAEEEIIYKGLDAQGKAIIEFRNPSSQITETIRSFKSLLEENRFIKQNLDKFSELSKRERDVLSLIGEGKKHQEIADALFISIHTVRDHIKNIKHKLSVTIHSELIQFFNAFLKN